MARQFSGGLHITQDFFTNEKGEDVGSISQAGYIIKLQERVEKVLECAEQVSHPVFYQHISNSFLRNLIKINTALVKA